ncbi:MAG: trigger factor [Oscillospiraceae bacterium]|nr:trigger factor [Oscillospiraceae bacterium]
MSLKSVDTSEKNTAVLEIEIAKNIFDETVTKIFRAKAANMSVPGFRKGKAPRNIIEKMYGKGVFYEEALNELLPQAVDEAVAESKIKQVSRPEIDVKEIDENGVVVTAKFTVKPEVEIKNYKNLEASKTVVIVSPEDIDKEVEAVRKRNARSIEITDRPAQKDDEVNIDFEGFVDDIPFEGGKADGHKLKLGSGEFIPGFEDQITGKNIGDEFDVNVTFPEDYHGEDVKGKEAVFKVKLNEIRYEELPELDDEFAQDVSEFDTLEAYREDVKSKIKERNNKRADVSVEEQLVDGIIANLEADIPEIMITNEVDNQFQDYAYRMQSQGIDMDMYMKYTGMTAEAMRGQFKDNAERQVKTRLALEKIVALENIEASEEDIEKEYDKMAEAYKMEKDQIKERVDANMLKEDITVRKAVEFVKENANITEVEKTLKEFEEELHKHNHDHHGHDHDHDHDDDEDFDDGEDIYE